MTWWPFAAQDGHSPGLQFAIVGMSPEAEDAELAVLRGNGRTAGRFLFGAALRANQARQQQTQHDHADKPAKHPKRPEIHDVRPRFVSYSGSNLSTFSPWAGSAGRSSVRA